LNAFKQYKFNQLADGIANMDDKIFNPAQVQGLITLLPPPEEVANIKDYLANGGEKDKLAPAEQFALEVNELPGLQTRLKAFLYKVTFDSRKCDVKPGIDAVTKACAEVKDSKKLSKILEVRKLKFVARKDCLNALGLQIVLHVGNFLNCGTNNGQAFGFKLSTLGKLADAKTTDNKSNLLSVIVEAVEQNSKELLDFGAELGSIEAATKVNMGMLQGDLVKLTRELEQVKKSLETVEKRGDSDLFHTKLAVRFPKKKNTLLLLFFAEFSDFRNLLLLLKMM